MLEDELAWQDSRAIFNQIWQYLIDVIVRIYLCFFLDEVLLSFSAVTHTGRHHQMCSKLLRSISSPSVAIFFFFFLAHTRSYWMWMRRGFHVEVFSSARNFSSFHFLYPSVIFASLQSLQFDLSWHVSKGRQLEITFGDTANRSLAGR